MSATPAKLLRITLRNLSVSATFPTDDGWQDYPYQWAAEIDVVPQQHGANFTPTPYMYTATDVNVGDYIVTNGQGRVLKITAISEQTSTNYFVCTLEDERRTNIMEDDTSNGVGSIPLGEGLLFEVKNGWPILHPIPNALANLLPPYFASDVLSRFLAYKADNTRVGLYEISADTNQAAQPVELRLTTTSTTGWSADNLWGRMSFYSYAAGAETPDIQAAIDVQAANDGGSLARLVFSVTDGSALNESLHINSAGQIVVGAAQPALAFRDDLTTGIQFDSPNTVSLVTGGVQALQINNTGTVVNGDLILNDKLVASNDPNTFISFPAADTFSIKTGGAERLRVKDTGAIRVGSSTTVGRIELASPSTAKGTAAAPATSGVLAFPNYNNVRDLCTIQSIAREGNYFAGQLAVTCANASGAAQTYIVCDGQDDYVSLRTGNAERVRIDSAGRITVGPPHSFSADGISTESSASGTTSQMQYRLKDNAGGFSYLGLSQPEYNLSGSELNGGAGYVASNAGNFLVTAQGAGDSVKILTGGFQDSNVRMTVDSAGRVSIVAPSATGATDSALTVSANTVTGTAATLKGRASDGACQLWFTDITGQIKSRIVSTSTYCYVYVPTGQKGAFVTSTGQEILVARDDRGVGVGGTGSGSHGLTIAKEQIVNNAVAAAATHTIDGDAIVADAGVNAQGEPNSANTYGFFDQPTLNNNTSLSFRSQFQANGVNIPDGSTGTLDQLRGFTAVNADVRIPVQYGFYSTVNLTPNSTRYQFLADGSAPSRFDGVITVAAGTGSAGTYSPGVQFTVDPNTGIQQIGGADTFSIVTGGNERLRINANGDVRLLNLATGNPYNSTNADGQPAAGDLNLDIAALNVGLGLGNASTSGTNTVPVRVLSPGGGNFVHPRYNTSGYLKITLPPTTATSTMLQFYLDIYEFVTHAPRRVTLSISGYWWNGLTNYGARWRECAAQIVSEYPADKDIGYRVYFGFDGHACIWIEKIKSEAFNWGYLVASVRDFVGGWTGGNLNNWNSGWALSMTTVAPQNTAYDPAIHLVTSQLPPVPVIDATAPLAIDSITKTSLADVTFAKFKEVVVASLAVTGNVTVSLDAGTIMQYSLLGDATFLLPAAEPGRSFTLVISNTLGRTVSWSTTGPQGANGVVWPNGQAPNQSPNGVDVYSFIGLSDVWLGAYAQNY